MKNKRSRKTGRARAAEKIYNRRVKERPRYAEGVFYSNSKGGVFFETSDGIVNEEQKYFVDLDCTHGAMNGDTVVAKLRRKDMSAVVGEITERKTETLVGTLTEDERYDPPFWFEPEDSKIRFEFSVTGAFGGASYKDGDKVLVRIRSYPEFADDCPECEIIRVFGSSDTVEANYQAILHSCEIPTEFDPKTLKEAERLSEQEVKPDGRVDLRDKFIMTIDGADAKDLDDAVCVERNGSGYILGVHIADVSHYVTSGSSVDFEAFERGTSVYFTDKVVPMLPKSLSNGICSLDSGVDRYALSAEIYLNKFGEIEKCELAKTVIRSKIHGIYSEFNQLLTDDVSAELSEKYSELLGERLDVMTELYRLLRRKNEGRGMLELESRESAIILGDNGLPCDIVARERGEGERLIEQFMLCANEAVATWLTERGYPCVYRVHEAPSKEKLSDFIKFAQAVGLSPEYVRLDRVTPAYFSDILDKAKKKDLGEPVSYMLLRTMSKAKYSETRAEHFGLASKSYCHFTSPIRRYPDLAVHRIITEALKNPDASALKKKYSAFAASAAKNSSETELRSMQAEREIEDLYKCIYMRAFIGKALDARVSSVTQFGLFCMTDSLCEGLVPINSMRNRYSFDKETLTLKSASGRYRLGDKVKIKVVSADITTRKVEFSLEDEPNDHEIFAEFGDGKCVSLGRRPKRGY